MQTIRDLGTILGIWAHPDDETYLSGAVMAAAAANGQRVVLFHATRGEQGTDDPQLAGARLGALRTVEMARARAALGVSEQWFYDFPDGGCADVPLDDALRKLMPVVASVQPDTILTFGPDGITGHPDHCTVSDWATHAWSRSRGKTRLLYATSTPERATEYAALNDELGIYPPGLPVTTPSDHLALHLDPAPDLLARKRAALAAHASQTSGLVTLMGEATYTQWAASESFVDVQTARALAAPMLRSA
jgi:LmbE family N-acetylglucosaminyl deacetylase